VTDKKVETRKPLKKTGSILKILKSRANKFNFKKMASYHVKYKVNNTTSGITLQLQGGTESEAIAKMKQQNNVPKDANVIILSIEKK
jgi:hypothetical protein